MSVSSQNIELQSMEHPMETAEVSEVLSDKDLALHLIHRRIYEVAAAAAAGKEVLDFGCNNGYGSDVLASLAAHVTGIDVSPTALETARSKYVRDNLEFQRFDGITFPFPDDHFDLVTSFQVIEHLEDPHRLLREVARVLRPDGFAIFTTPQAAIRLDPGMRPWNRFHVREYRTEELRNELGGVFQHVEMLGSFAVGELYIVEYERNQKALERSRLDANNRAEHQRAKTAKLGAMLRRMIFGEHDAIVRTMPAQGAALNNFLETAPFTGKSVRGMTTEDVFYRRHDLDVALDLVAVVSNSNRWSLPPAVAHAIRE